MTNDMEPVILQGGVVKCPVCGTVIKWKCKVTKCYLTEFDRFATCDDCIPCEHVRYITTSDGKVRFNICCTKCVSVIETENMDLIDKSNYDKNSE